MSIVVYILIIVFGFLIVNHIFEHGFKAIEGMVRRKYSFFSRLTLVGRIGPFYFKFKKKFK